MIISRMSALGARFSVSCAALGVGEGVVGDTVNGVIGLSSDRGRPFAIIVSRSSVAPAAALKIQLTPESAEVTTSCCP